MLLKDYAENINRYRNPILGFCVLLVIIYHAEIAFISGPLGYLFNLLWEMDIFFFLSGLGLYYSFTKDEKLLSFYRRRVVRIYSRYWPVLLIYELSILVVYSMSGYIIGNVPLLLQQILGNVFLLGWYAGLDNQFNWYIQSLMVFYFFAPVLILLVRRLQGNRKKLALLIGFFLLTQVCFFGSRMLIAYARSIPFLLGIITADFLVREENLRLNVPTMLLLFVMGNVLCYYGNGAPVELGMHYGLCWYPSTLVLPGALYLLPLVFSWCEKIGFLHWVTRAFGMLGKYSLEGYLVNILIYDILVRWGVPIRGNFLWMTIVVAICFAFVGYGSLLARKGKKKTA